MFTSLVGQTVLSIEVCSLVVGGRVEARRSGLGSVSARGDNSTAGVAIESAAGTFNNDVSASLIHQSYTHTEHQQLHSRSTTHHSFNTREVPRSSNVPSASSPQFAVPMFLNLFGPLPLGPNRAPHPPVAPCPIKNEVIFLFIHTNFARF